MAGAAAVEIEERTMLVDIDSAAGALPLRLITDNCNGSRVELDEKLLAAIEQRQPAPRRRTGTHKLDELDSFIRLVNRLGEVHSTLWAEVSQLRITAVFNDGASGVPDPGWRDYRAIYTCPLSPEWVLWKQNEGQPMRQTPPDNRTKAVQADAATATTSAARSDRRSERQKVTKVAKRGARAKAGMASAAKNAANSAV
jgi:hypothetical protein